MLRTSEEQFRRAIEEAPIPMIMHAEDGEVLQISRSWTELTGYTLADVPTLDAWLNRAYGHGADAVRNHVHDLFAGSQRSLNVTFDVRTRAGELRHWSFNASSPGVLRDGRRFVVGMALDITERKRAEQAVRESEERFRLLVEGARDYAMFLLDPQSRITFWSLGAERVFGWSEGEALGQGGDIVFTEEDRAAGAPEQERATARREGSALDRRWHVRKDGRLLFVDGTLIRLDDERGGLRGFVKIARDASAQREVEEALQRAHDELEQRVQERTAALAASNQARQELLRQLVKAQEEERLRIARDLHDQLGQHITALLLGLKQLEGAAQSTPLAAMISPLQELTQQLAKDAHHLAVNLRPTALDDVGLLPALERLVTDWSLQTGVTAAFHSQGIHHERLPLVVETTLYRAVQEALTNVGKHAEAQRVSVLLERRDEEVVAIVEDDGRGFDPEAAPARTERPRLGLRGMQERVAQVGGMLEIESSPGGGTTLFIRVPHGDWGPRP